MTLLNRFAGNPILKPNSLNAWEALNTFNAGVIFHNNLFHMVYRAQGLDYISYIGYAVSADGYNWARLDKPVFSPGTDYETRGVEDPRLTALEGKFYMTYTAWSPSGIRTGLTVSENLISWERLGIMLPGEDNKDTALFPARIGGRYCLLHRREPDIWLGYSDDLHNWGDHQVIMKPIAGGWEAKKIGIGGPPVRIDQGWLLIYHAVDADNVYRLGVALLDAKNPARVLARCAEPILEPREMWEIKGDVPNVVFSCGQVVKDGVVYVYYGGADRLMGVATCSLEEMLAVL
jgi:beta-1,2-mannobiose phosphorylase / 1,2-beta-oligomannan phosphorylase